MGSLWDPKGHLGVPWGALGYPERAKVAPVAARMRFLGRMRDSRERTTSWAGVLVFP